MGWWLLSSGATARSFTFRPTQHLAILVPQSPPIDKFYVFKIGQSTNFQAIKSQEMFIAGAQLDKISNFSSETFTNYPYFFYPLLDQLLTLVCKKCL